MYGFGMLQKRITGLSEFFYQKAILLFRGGGGWGMGVGDLKIKVCHCLTKMFYFLLDSLNDYL